MLHTTTPTKQQEIDHLRQYVAARPDGYVKDILGKILPAIETAIRNDIGWIHYNPHEQEREKRELAEQIKAMQEELREMNALADQHQRRAARAAAELEDIRSAARELSRH